MYTRIHPASLLAPGILLVALSSSAQAQFAISWSSIDCGGTTTPSTGGAYGLAGTIGQSDAGPPMTGGSYGCDGGTWPGNGASCYVNCDGSTATPVLTANDFQCFLNNFASNDPYANCDGSTSFPALTANDFQCFLNKFAAGCT